MQSQAERLANLSRDVRGGVLAGLSDGEQAALLYDWRGFWARPEQVMPPGEWAIWLVLAGRGFGKTRTGAEAVREEVETGRSARIGLVAETAADARDVMAAEVMRIFPDSERPTYTPSTRKITFQNGAVAFTYNATDPDQLRGPQHDFLWHDEIAKWRYAQETWDQAQFGLRIGTNPRQVVTTTPRPIALIKALIAGTEGLVHVTRGSTSDNASNLAPAFIERIRARYDGTRLGRQELHAEILSDMPGAIWAQETIEVFRVRTAPPLKRIVVAIDPAVTAGGDEHGIVVVGLANDQTAYVIEDASLNGTPLEWARTVWAMYRKHSADTVVAEVNNGGDMIRHTLQSVAPNINVREVRATRGKHVRAEPIAALYAQGRIRHVGQFAALENQMTQFTSEGYQGSGSPDRVDALVWAATELFPDMVDTAPALVPFRMPRRAGGWAA